MNPKKLRLLAECLELGHISDLDRHFWSRELEGMAKGMERRMADSYEPVRNPRLDPKPGDVLRYGHTYARRYVEVVENSSRMLPDDVSFMQDGLEFCMSKVQWTEFIGIAEVLEVVDAFKLKP